MMAVLVGGPHDGRELPVEDRFDNVHIGWTSLPTDKPDVEEVLTVVYRRRPGTNLFDWRD